MSRKSEKDHVRGRKRPSRWERALTWRWVLATSFAFLFAVYGDSILAVKHLLKLLPVEVPVSVDAVLASGSSALGIAPPHGELQVTLVDIDEALYASWGRPCITPRDRLQEVIAAVADRHPAAIVVDVNLGCGDRGAALGGYLEKYAGPAPLILVRGLHVEQDPSNAARQQVRMDATPYDDAVAANPSISWGHTFYSTDEDGTVRRWRDWWEACTDTGTATVPALPLRLLAVLPRGAGGAPPPQAPEHRGDCGLESQASPERIVVLGPRIVGHARARADSGAPRIVPARQLLDPSYAVESNGYFSLENRVVIIGATHSGAGDAWRTAIGYLAGMELLAHTVRFAPLQLAESAPGAAVPLLMTLVAFLVLAVLFYVLRSVWAFPLAVFAIFAMIQVEVGMGGRYEAYGSIESALWLFVMYELLVGFTRILCSARRGSWGQKARAIFLSDEWREDHDR